ncbi:MAG: glycosyltransferase family 39 protein [Acidobacteriota bacterium]
MVKRDALLTIALVLLLRLPFLNEAVQGDDLYYLYGAQHAQIDPLHPLHTHYAFLGEMVDMRGHPHGPLNSWVLGSLIAIFGEVREVPFHAAYLLFSIAAALAMLALARRFAPDHALAATALFCVFPAFVVNGGSLEADLPFLAFWMLSIVLFMKAIDTRSILWLAASCIAGALAGLDAYQAVMLTPILAAYLWMRDLTWLPAWPAILAAPVTIVLWQVWEWAGSGVLPITVLLGYMKSGSLQSASNKWASAVTLTGHLLWLILPALAFKSLLPRKEFLRAWIWIFFAASLVIFFAGSARYLLPLYAPLAIVIANEVGRTRLLAAIAIHLIVSLGLASANAQHWNAERDFANRVMDQANGHRVWANAEFGLRHYLEDRGALPLLRDTVLRDGDIVVTSDLAQPVTVNAPLARLTETLVSPSVPLPRHLDRRRLRLLLRIERHAAL